MSELRAIIVDDEPAAIRRMTALLCVDPRVSAVGTAKNGEEALSLIERLAPDLLFLDIDMPGMSGMELAEALSNRGDCPKIVFVTAFDRFAIHAFDVSAAGYLLKPVDRTKLKSTIGRLVENNLIRARADDAALWLGSSGLLRRVPVTLVTRLEAERDFVRIHLPEASYLMPGTLSAATENLGRFGMIRIHKSHSVPVGRISELRHLGHGAWQALLENGDMIPIGRKFLDELRARVGA